MLRYSWVQELYLCQILSFKKNLNYLEVQMTSEKFEFLVSGELLFDFCAGFCPFLLVVLCQRLAERGRHQTCPSSLLETCQ